MDLLVTALLATLFDGLVVAGVLQLWLRGSIFGYYRARIELWSGPVTGWLGELLLCPQCLGAQLALWSALVWWWWLLADLPLALAIAVGIAGGGLGHYLFRVYDAAARNLHG